MINKGNIMQYKIKHFVALAMLVTLILPSYASFSIESNPEDIYNNNINNFNNKCVFFAKYFEERLAIPKGLLHSVSTAESSLNPWTINIQGKAYYFSSKNEAVDFVKTKLNQGVKSIDVGCMQINLYHHGDAFKSLETAIDPKTNISYAAFLLKNGYKRNYSWQEAIANYHSKHENLGKNYASKVLKIWKNHINGLVKMAQK